MALRLDKFHELLQDLGLYHDYHHVLVENGFDNWESISYLNIEALESIGIKEEIKVQEILSCVEAAGTMRDEEEVLNQSAETLKQESDLIEEVKHGGRERSESRGSTHEILKNHQPITEAVLVKGTSAKREKKETVEKFLARLNQLYLNEKGITQINNLQACPQLQALFLHDNGIHRIENLEPLSNLTTLNLQGNFIRKMENLQSLKKLKKLTLSKNMISAIEGLEYCQDLEELYVSHQNIKEELVFDLTSMAIIANSLLILEADGNKITNTSNLAYLSSLQTMSLRGNEIKEVTDLERMLACMNRLSKLDIRENPIEKVPKFRDQVVMMAPSLVTLNNKKILENERTFLMRFYNIKSNAQGKVKSTDRDGAKPVKKGVDLSVAGSGIREDLGKENRKVTDGLNRAQDFSMNTVHTMSKKGSLK